MPLAMHKIVYHLVMVALIALMPFSLYNYFLENYLIASLITLLCISLFYIRFMIRHKQAYNSHIVFWLTMPMICSLLYLLVANKGLIGVLWCYPSIMIVNFVLPQRTALFSNLLIIIFVTPPILNLFELDLLLRIYVTLITAAMLSSLFVNIINDQHNNLHQIAISDPLTGLHNRLTLQDNLNFAIQQHVRISTPMTLASIDIDHFKKINDTYGHDIGDKVLIQIANLLQTRSRSVDKVYRLGGEEFLIILFNTNLKNAHTFADAIQQKLLEEDFGDHLAPTVSIGLAEVDQHQTWEKWLKKADEKLYIAKNDGRNRIKG